jgi:hypothetical protein
MRSREISYARDSEMAHTKFLVKERQVSELIARPVWKHSESQPCRRYGLHFGGVVRVFYSISSCAVSRCCHFLSAPARWLFLTLQSTDLVFLTCSTYNLFHLLPAPLGLVAKIAEAAMTG